MQAFDLTGRVAIANSDAGAGACSALPQAVGRVARSRTQSR